MLDVISLCGSDNCYYNGTCWMFSHAATNTTAIIMAYTGRSLTLWLIQLLLLWHMLDVLSRLGSYNCYYNDTCWTFSYAAAHITANIITQLDFLSFCGSYYCCYNDTYWTLSQVAAHATAIFIAHSGRYFTLQLIQLLIMAHT